MTPYIQEMAPQVPISVACTALGRKTSMRDLDMTNPADSGSRWLYSYDNAGNLTQQTDAKGQVITFAYDPLNRLTLKRQGGTTLATYGYDEGAYGKGQRTSMTSFASGTNSAYWTYDARGRVTQESRYPFQDYIYRFQFTYTQGDLPVTIRYPGGESNQLGEIVTTQYYWQTGQPKSMAGDGTYVSDTTYREFGAPSQINMGANIVNTYAYDPAMRVNYIRYQVSGTDTFWNNLNYDKVGNVVSILDATPPGGGSWQWQYFVYDSLNRLIKASTSGGNAGSYTHSYAYDALGNLTQKAGVNMGYGQASGIGANAKPHAVTHLNGSQKFWYDHNGNMTRRIDEQNRDWTLTWTTENMLRSATAGSTSLNYTYDADGMMVMRAGNGHTVIHLGKLLEHNLNLGTFTKHYFFSGKIVATRAGLSSSSSVSFFATDHLGSTNVTIWANGSVRSRLRYDPWGKERYTQSTTPTGFCYTNLRWDAGLGLYDYNARYYDPHISRFISADVIVPGMSRLTPLTVGFHETMLLEQANGESRQLMQYGPASSWSGRLKQKLGVPAGPAAPQTLNRFAYANNNPLAYTDPTGHDALHNSLIGYEQLFNDDGTPKTDAEGNLLYRVWYHGQEKIVVQSPELVMFMLYAQLHDQAQSNWYTALWDLIAAGIALAAGTLLSVVTIVSAGAATVGVGPFSIPLWAMALAGIGLVIAGAITLGVSIKGISNSTNTIYTMDQNAQDVFRYQLHPYTP